MNRRLITLASTLLLLVVALFALAWGATPAHAQDTTGVDRGGPGDDDEARYYGELVSFPEGGGVGAWVVGTRTFTATEATEFEEDEGDFAVGVCVKVEYAAENPALALKIQTEPAGDCDGDGGDDDLASHYGLLVSFPEGGGAGAWVVGTRTFTATAETEFEEDDGAFAVGVCVKVGYDPTTPTIAAKIETESGHNGHDAAAAGVAHGSDCDDDGDDDGPGHGDFGRYYGELMSFPEGGGAGAWVVGTRTFTATTSTYFEEDEGDFAVGACVKVLYDDDAPAVALKIETESDDDDDCDDDHGDNDGDHDGDHDENEFYGRLVSFPEGGGEGTWVVGDRTFTADADTEFEQERGGFAVGVCVEVETDEATPTVAEKIETEPGYKCRGHDDDDDGDDEFDGAFFGRIEVLPAGDGLLGVWQISGISVTVTNTTQLEDERLPFAVGVTVKVKFVENAGEKVATEIKSVFRRGDGRLGHAWGPILSYPETLTGTWSIAGMDYIVTAETRLIQEPVPFAVGQNVKVFYYVNDAGDRVALLIKTTNGRGGGDDDSFKFVGFVEEKPADSLIGRWIIGGETFSTTESTRFDEDDGLLTVGAWVEVKYTIVGGQRIVEELEAETPPGCGDRDHMGRIEQIGDDSAAAAGLAAGDALWRIGGQTYVVGAATDLDEAAGALTVGGNALVNSYTAADGSQVATRISAVGAISNVYLPIMTR